MFLHRVKYIFCYFSLFVDLLRVCYITRTTNPHDMEDMELVCGKLLIEVPIYLEIPGFYITQCFRYVEGNICS